MVVFAIVVLFIVAVVLSGFAVGLAGYDCYFVVLCLFLVIYVFDLCLCFTAGLVLVLLFGFLFLFAV